MCYLREWYLKDQLLSFATFLWVTVHTSDNQPPCCTEGLSTSVTYALPHARPSPGELHHLPGAASLYHTPTFMQETIPNFPTHKSYKSCYSFLFFESYSFLTDILSLEQLLLVEAGDDRQSNHCKSKHLLVRYNLHHKSIKLNQILYFKWVINSEYSLRTILSMVEMR